MKMIHCFFALLTVTAPFTPAQGATSGPKDFTQVATTAIPAVVSIKVKAEAVSPFGQREDLDDFFGHNDFFKHFFYGMPERQRTPQIGQGSGFVISSDGYIITNAHVVKDATEMQVTLHNGKEYNAKLVGFDKNTDIALVKIEASGLPHLNLGNSDTLQVGQWVVAIGNPLGLQASLTVGVVSAKGRNNLDITRIEDFIQTDAAINRGNSGGPLLNLDGEVIGMNTAIVTSMGSGNSGIGFAIPSAMIDGIVAQLRDSGSVSRGFMGVFLQQIDHDLAHAFGLDKPEGALVSDLAADSPAAQAGIKQGDILLKFNERPITNGNSLRNTIAMMAPGTHVRFSVLRDHKIIEIPVTLGSHPEETTVTTSIGNELGIHVEKLTPDLARKAGIEGAHGVIVNKVENGSLAAWAGMRQGAVILEVNRRPVDSIESFNKALSSAGSGKPILLLIKQGDFTQYLSLKLK